MVCNSILVSLRKTKTDMKKFEQSADRALSRFAKDSRLRRDKKEDETKEERPRRTARRTETEERPKRTSSRTSSAAPKGGRRSFNPNFTPENRPVNSRSERRPKENEERGSFRGKDDRKRRTEAAPAEKKFQKRDSSRRPAREYGREEEKRSFRPRKSQTEEKPKSYPKYNPNKSQDEMRLNRFIAQSGMCSRREADEYIKAGLVTVNGKVVTEMGVKVKSTDEVRFSDEKVKAEKNVYILLNKPKGFVTTTEDGHAEHTVMELVANACSERIYPVGRLDKDSVGLLLFTNDGDITRALTHPSYKKKKIYEVTLDKALTRADFERLAEGITLEDGEAYFDEIQYIDDTKKVVGAEIHSGRNRIVRRMFESLGYKVKKLDRVYYAGLTKKDLTRGHWRFLTDTEVARLKSGRYE